MLFNAPTYGTYKSTPSSQESFLSPVSMYFSEKRWTIDEMYNVMKETLYNDYITNLENYIAIVEEWIEFIILQELKIGRKNSSIYYLKDLI